VTNSTGTITITPTTTRWSALESSAVTPPPLGRCFVFPVIRSNMTASVRCTAFVQADGHGVIDRILG
jgi:hypothetical protein